MYGYFLKNGHMILDIYYYFNNFGGLTARYLDFYRTQVRSLATLVSNSLHDSLTDV